MATACSTNNQNESQGNQTDILPQGVSVRDSHIEMRNDRNLSDQEKAQYLADLVAGIADVEGSSVIVIGDLAVVGIDVDGNTDRSKVGSIKNAVTESLRHDPHGANAVVIADPDITERLNEINQDIADGKPIQGIMNELSDIVGRVMPGLPVQEQGKNPEKGTEKQKNELNNQDSRQLERQQQEQSNHHKQ